MFVDQPVFDASNPIPVTALGLTLRGSRAVVTEVNADINLLVARVMAKLPQNAPWVGPRDVAPHLNIGADTFRYHCRNCRKLRLMTGDYRFRLDDAEHVAALRAVVKLAIWSGRKLPADLKPTSTRVH